MVILEATSYDDYPPLKALTVRNISQCGLLMTLLVGGTPAVGDLVVPRAQRLHLAARSSSRIDIPDRGVPVISRTTR